MNIWLLFCIFFYQFLACSIEEVREVLINHYSCVAAEFDFENNFFMAHQKVFFLDQESILNEIIKKIDQEIDVILKNGVKPEEAFFTLKKNLDKVIEEKFVCCPITNYPQTFALACTIRSYIQVDLEQYAIFCHDQRCLKSKEIKSKLKALFRDNRKQVSELKDDLEAQSAFKLCLIDTYCSFQPIFEVKD